jgi:hypothetical protein
VCTGSTAFQHNILLQPWQCTAATLFFAELHSVVTSSQQCLCGTGDLRCS